MSPNSTIANLASTRWFTVFLSGLIAIAPFAIDVYLPSMSSMSEYFDASMAATNLTLSSYLIGNAIGQFFGGSLSDQLGRRPIGLVGLALFIVSSVLIIFAPSIEWVQFYRITQALGGGFASVIVMAQVRDVYPTSEVGKRYANVLMVVYLAPLIAPIIGAGLTLIGWQSVFVFLTAYATLCFVILFLFVPETLAVKPERFQVSALFKGYVYVIQHKTNGDRAGLKLAFFGGFSAAVFLSFLVNSAMIYMHYFALSPFQFAIAFACNALMLMSGNRIAASFMNRYPDMLLLRRAHLVQLLMLFVLVLSVAAGAYNFWSVFIVLQLVLLIHGGIVSLSGAAYIKHFEVHSGSAASLKATLRLVIGGSVGGVAAFYSEGQLLPILFAMLGVQVLARLILMSVKDQPAAPLNSAV